MTQQEMARQMRESGWKWSQATVWAVEKGERPLRLAEAADLARITHVHDPGWFSKERATAEMDAAGREWLRAKRELEQAPGEYLEVQIQLASAADFLG